MYFIWQILRRWTNSIKFERIQAEFHWPFLQSLPLLFELDNDDDDDDEEDDDDDDDDDSCFAIFVARQDGVTNRKTLLWKFTLSLFLALTLKPNTYRIAPHHVSPEAKSPSIALTSTWYIFADQVLFRPYALRYIRLRSLVVNFHLALIEHKSIQNFSQICIHAWKETNADLNIRYAKKWKELTCVTALMGTITVSGGVKVLSYYIQPQYPCTQKPKLECIYFFFIPWILANRRQYSWVSLTLIFHRNKHFDVISMVDKCTDHIRLLLICFL